jgi:hypothetical protein
VTYLAVWLISTGLCDLFRARRDVVSRRDVALISAAAVCALVVLAVVCGATSGVGWLLLVLSAVGLVLWVVGSAAALNNQGSRGGQVERRLAHGALIGTTVVLLAASGRVSVAGSLVGRWYDGLGIAALGNVPVDTFLLGAGLLLFQISSANIVVRMVLDGVGTPAASAEQTLRGGRLLGPLERLFILGLGMAGYVTAASIVIAAKGLLRYPELREQASSGRETGQHRGEVSEYFLVGSFVSWLLAMVGLPLL